MVWQLKACAFELHHKPRLHLRRCCLPVVRRLQAALQAAFPSGDSVSVVLLALALALD